MTEKRIYINDRNVPYKKTEIAPIDSKRDIDGALARWGVKRVAWEWDPDPKGGNVQVSFQFEEVVDGVTVYPVVVVKCPRIWRKSRSRKVPETVKWDTSMRVLWWYMKSHLEHAYLMSSITVEFLPHITTPALQGTGKTVKDYVIPKLSEMEALPDLEELM